MIKILSQKNALNKQKISFLKILKKMILGTLLASGLILTGCASSPTLNSPCPHFGAQCEKSPVNSWDYYHSN